MKVKLALALFIMQISNVFAMDILGPESFDTVTPAGWTQFDVGTLGNLWAANNNRPSPDSGGNAAFFDDFNGANDVWLISPSFNTSGTTSVFLDYNENVNFSGSATTHEVLYSTNYSGSGDPNLATWTTINSTIGPEDAWMAHSFNISAVAGNTSVYVAFRYAGDFASEWWIDDVRVFEPSALQVEVNAPADTNLSIGSIINFTFRVTNTGSSPDTYDLTGSGSAFDALSTNTTTMLASGAFEDIQVRAQTDCALGPAETLTLTATSQTSGAVSAQDTVTLTLIDDVNSGENGGYFFANSVSLCANDIPPFNWVDISGTGTDVIGSLDDDNFIGPFPIGFSFNFFGNDYTEFYIGSNGWISFNNSDPGAAAGRNNTALPTAGAPNDLIAVFWDDMNPDDPDPGNSHVYYGNGPAGELVVTFERLPEFGADADGWITTQVLLFANGNIRIQNQDSGSSIDLSGATVGIENSDGTVGVQYLLNGTGGPLFSSPLSIEFGTDQNNLPVVLETFEID